MLLKASVLGLSSNTVNLRIEARPQIDAGPHIQARVWFICTDRSWGRLS